MSQEQSPPRTARPDGKIAAIVLAVSALVAILAVAQHPTVAIRAPAQAIPELVRLAPLDRLVHGILIAVMLALLFAFSIFSLRRGLDRQTTVGGFVAYAFGCLAVIGAAIIDGRRYRASGVVSRRRRPTPDAARVT